MDAREVGQRSLKILGVLARGAALLVREAALEVEADPLGPIGERSDRRVQLRDPRVALPVVRSPLP
jgi:hypothetical protein